MSKMGIASARLIIIIIIINVLTKFSYGDLQCIHEYIIINVVPKQRVFEMTKQKII
jgi:hypothetical protein